MMAEFAKACQDGVNMQINSRLGAMYVYHSLVSWRGGTGSARGV